jgi:DNA-binding LacI/PurR family transcriptional regulator
MSPVTRPTLAILAEKLGVTPATISVALRGKGRMREELRQKIIVTAMELGYRPNQAAKAMLEGQSRQIALVQGRADDRSTLPQNVLAGCVDRLTELGYQLTVLRLSDQELSSERKLPRFVQESHCDGMILNYTHDIPEQLLRILNQFHLPYVFSTRICLRTPCVQTTEKRDVMRPRCFFLLGTSELRLSLARVTITAPWKGPRAIITP